MIEKLREMNKKLIEVNANNPEELEKQELIRKILSVDECFLNMSIDTAYAILRDLKIEEDSIKSVYYQLI